MPHKKSYVRITALLISLFVLAIAVAGVCGIIKNKDIFAGPANTEPSDSTVNISSQSQETSDMSDIGTESSDNSTEQPQPGASLPDKYQALWITEADLPIDNISDLVSRAKALGFTVIILDVSADTDSELVSQISDCAEGLDMAFQINLTFVFENTEDVTKWVSASDKIASVFLPDEIGGDKTAELRTCFDELRISADIGIYTGLAAPSSLPENIDCVCVALTAADAENVITSWSDALSGSEIPMFTALSVDKTEADKAPDYMAKMQALTNTAVNYRGTAVRNASEMFADTTGATAALFAVLEGKGDAVFDAELNIIEPVESEYSTYGVTFTLRGTANPLYELTVNGESVSISENGSFMWTCMLSAGQNTVEVRYMGKTTLFNVERKIDVINRINPDREIYVNGGTVLTVSAKALYDAEVTATLNGTKITLVRDDNFEYDDIEEGGGYVTFFGTVEIPDATEEVQDLGKIRFKGIYEGYSESVSGGRIRVNAYVPPVTDKDTVSTVKVTASHLDGRNYTKTYNPKYSDDNSDPTHFFFATGMIDEVVDEITANGEDGPVECYLLSTGVLIHKEDCELTEREKIKNSISSAALSEDGKYTVIRFVASEPVAVVPSLSPLKFQGKHPMGYTLKSFNSSSVELLFSNTYTVSDILGFANNDLFSSYKWERLEDGQYKLILTLKKSGGFYGIKTEIDGNGRIVISFKNSVTLEKDDNKYGYSLEGVKVVLDAGHNGNYPYNPGAAGFLDGLHECNLNLMLAEKTKTRLEALGAEVIMTRVNNASDMTKDERVAKIISSNADVCIAIHHNGSSYSNLYGMSTYYFYPFAKDFSQSVYDEMLQVYETYIYPEGSGKNNYAQGCRYYPYYMTRIQEFPCILVEAGHITNRYEYDFLIKDEIQNYMADAFTEGIVNYFISQQ